MENTFVFNEESFQEDPEQNEEIGFEVDSPYQDEVSEQEEYEEMDSPFQALTEMLLDSNVIDSSLLDEFDYADNPDGILNLINDTVEKRWESFVEEKFSDERYQTVLSIIENGGDLSDIAEIYNEVDYAAVDLDDVDNQTQLIRDFYESKGISESNIEKLIKNAMDDGSWSDEVLNAHSALINMQIDQANELREQLETRNYNMQLEAQEHIESLHRTLNNIDEINGFELDNNDKQRFFDYMTTPVTRDGQTQLELDYSNEHKQLEMAFMSFINFNNNDMQTVADSRAAEKLARSLESLRDGTARQGSYGSNDSVLDDVVWFK